MSEQMNVAIELMEQLRGNLESCDFALVNNNPNIVFLKTLKDRLINLGFSPNGVSIDEFVNNFSIDIAESTEKKVAEYLGISFAEILYDMNKKLGDDFEFWSAITRNMSIEFDV